MKILLATDGSVNAVHAAQFLCRWKVGSELDLVLLTVSADPRQNSFGNLHPWDAQWQEHAQRYADEHHAALMPMFAEHFHHVTTQQCTGDPAEQILAAADQLDADLIVLGATGHSAISRMLLGSVSDRVATHASCSVLVARPAVESTAASNQPPARDRPLRIALAYDRSDSACGALQELLGLEWDRSTNLQLVSVVPRYDYLLGDGLNAAVVTNEDELSQEMQAQNRQVVQQLQRRLPSTNSEVLSGQHIGDMLVRHADQNHTDLIVLGDAGHGMLHDWLLGSTTKYVLRHAPCSVWISRHFRAGNTVNDAQQQTAVAELVKSFGR